MPLELAYRSDHGGLVDEFYVPCLTASVEYVRAVGYFTSRSLAIVAAGLPTFIHNGGYVRLVVSPQLELADVEAMSSGYERRSRAIEGALERAIRDVSQDSIERERLGFLAWMIAAGQLDIRVAVRKDANGIYHEKFGVFIDASGDAVMFTGSPNETVGGLVSNFESIDVFTSWSDTARVAIKRVAFNALWENKTNGVQVLPLPEAIRQRLLTYAPDRRPARDPMSLRPTEAHTPIGHAGDEQLQLPADVHTRTYQAHAIESWRHAGYRGIWEMATGTGKTLTALAAATEWATEHAKVLLVVAAPLKHLVDQWADQMARFGLDPILCRDSVSSWSPDLRDRLDLLRLGLVPVVSCVVTHQTLGSQAFKYAIEQQGGDAVRLLIADEVHHLGAEIRADSLSDSYTARLGLSATPRRWNDEAGDVRLEDFFGPIVFQFTLQEAIAQGYLTRYEYKPILVELDDQEMDEYVFLTREIVNAWTQNRDDATKNALLRRRSALLNSARGKLEFLKQLFPRGGHATHTLIYTTSGQMDAVVSVLAHHSEQRVHRFTYREEPATRQNLLRGFANGEIEILTAIRCLDEGVDVPSTRTAVLLASSGNPRQFIQRRGRILRPYPSKDHAVIYDLIAIPSESDRDEDSWPIERSILRRELARFVEFADSAANKYEARQVLYPLQQRYELLDL